MRVLLLATPLDARAHLDGTRLAVLELAEALSSLRIATPLVLVRPGMEAPSGCEAIVVEGRSPLSIVTACVRARPDVVHAMFAPRRRTGLVLAAIAAGLGVPVVQTIASTPGDGPRAPRLRWPTLAGDIIVATSIWMLDVLARAGWEATRRALVPMPFRAPLDVQPDASVKQPLFLHAGDWEDGSGIDETLDAFAQLSAPRGVVPQLAFAGRRKSARSARHEAELRARIEASHELSGRVRILGELPSLLPFVAAARCVLLPARSTKAKLDHPRVLLESIALGTRIVVGAAPSLAELVRAPSIGEAVGSTAALREAMERTFETAAPSPLDVLATLASRRPEIVAAAYGELYARVLRTRRGG